MCKVVTDTVIVAVCVCVVGVCSVVLMYSLDCVDRCVVGVDTNALRFLHVHTCTKVVG